MAGRGLDQLTSDPHPMCCLADAAFEDIAHTEIAADLLYVNRPALVGEARIAGDDKKPADRDSPVMMSSTTPSAKYSCSGSPLMFWNGSTAIDGLSGSGGPVLADGVADWSDMITL